MTNNLDITVEFYQVVISACVFQSILKNMIRYFFEELLKICIVSLAQAAA